ncbi:replication factor C small subunit [Candidatus Woesearchaeota archaeon]|nr:MAG: replication factor C small subunit [Candidatus Woesearchaeota archaeon]
MNTIWTEKYRPKTFEEVKGQKEIVERAKAFVEMRNMPHLLLAGPAGVGKTTLTGVIVRQMFGEDWKQNFLDLNASDERGIDVIRNTIKDFAKLKTIGNYPFKIIHLDECDSLTKEAQQALRRTMENYALSTRFILSANFSSKIIDPIQSRCTVFRFKPLKKEEVFEVMENIAKGEGINITDDAKEALYEVTNGDVRRLVNVMQSSASINKNFDRALVYSLVSAAKPEEIRQVLQTAINGDFINARKQLLNVMLEHGLSGLDVVKQIQKEIWNLDVDDLKKVKLVDKCGEIEFRMVEGSDEYLQLEALLANFVQ